MRVGTSCVPRIRHRRRHRRNARAVFGIAVLLMAIGKPGQRDRSGDYELAPGDQSDDRPDDHHGNAFSGSGKKHQLHDYCTGWCNYLNRMNIDEIPGT